MAKSSVGKIIQGVASGDMKTVSDELKVTLTRSIGLAGVVVISLSAMLPGIFVTPSFAAEIMGAWHMVGLPSLCFGCVTRCNLKV